MEILFVLLYIYAFWALYVFSMGIYRAHLAKRLKGLNRILALPIITTAYLVDVFANFTIAVFVFAELPKEWLVTTRMQRYMAEGETAGYQYKIAKYLCDEVLDPFDPTGNHC